MKIIGHTQYGYLAELSSHELAQLTGNPDDQQHAGFNSAYGQRQETHHVGKEFKISETWKHLQCILANEPKRKQIAESLRAAATLIEHTPSPVATPDNEEGGGK